MAPSFDPARVRTLLFVPADDARKRERAWTAGADAVILDLEDAVAPDAKAAARAGLADVLAGRPAGPLAVVRVNAPDTPDGERDLEALAGLPVDAVMVPKAKPATVAGLQAHSFPVIALVETAVGVLRAEAIARSPAVVQLMFGPVDLAAELGAAPGPTGEELLLARSALVIASAAAGLAAPIDGPYLDVRDADGLRAEAERARRLGYGAKSCIHPGQLEHVARVFTPSADELDWARRVVAAYESAQQRGSGVIALDGRMIDVPVARRAQAILKRSGDDA